MLQLLNSDCAEQDCSSHSKSHIWHRSFVDRLFLGRMHSKWRKCQNNSHSTWVASVSASRLEVLLRLWNMSQNILDQWTSKHEEDGLCVCVDTISIHIYFITDRDVHFPFVVPKNTCLGLGRLGLWWSMDVCGSMLCRLKGSTVVSKHENRPPSNFMFFSVFHHEPRTWR